MRVIMIAAMSENRVIGRGGELPWHLPADLRRFKQLTTGHPVIMGRRTFDTLDKPLPNRMNIIITRQQGFSPGDDPLGQVRVAHDFEDALRIAESTGAQDVFVIGGGEIYSLALPRAGSIELTVVHTRIEDGDAWFPELDQGEWQRMSAERHAADDRHAHTYTFERWERA